MNTLKIIAAIVIGFLLGAGAVLTRAPAVTVHEEFQPASIRAPGPDWMQPGDEQAVAIPAGTLCFDANGLVVDVSNCGPFGGGTVNPASCYEIGHSWSRPKNWKPRCGHAIPAVSQTTGYSMGWCSDGMIWPARSDGSCWMADKPER